MKGRIKFVPVKVFSAFYADSCFVILLFKICLMKFRFIEWVSILEVMHVLTTSILINFFWGVYALTAVSFGTSLTPPSGGI